MTTLSALGFDLGPRGNRRRIVSLMYVMVLTAGAFTIAGRIPHLSHYAIPEFTLHQHEPDPFAADDLTSEQPEEMPAVRSLP